MDHRVDAFWPPWSGARLAADGRAECRTPLDWAPGHIGEDGQTPIRKYPWELT